MFKKLPLSVLVGLIVSTPINAEETRQHSAHVHGQVEMNVAQDGHDLLIEISSPGVDIVGFEHAPENEEQHQQVDAAIEKLKLANHFIQLTASAECTLETASVSSQGEVDAHDAHEGHDHDAHEEHEGHDHDSHEEHEGHDHDSHEEHEEHDHDHDHDHDDHDHAGYKDYTIEYAFHCEKMDKLDSLTTTWFKEFPTVKEIHVNVFTDKQQTAVELKADQPSVQL